MPPATMATTLRENPLSPSMLSNALVNQAESELRPGRQTYIATGAAGELDSNSALLCKIAIGVDRGRSVKITQQIDLVVARQFEHRLVKCDHQRAVGLKI
jgi:hypothetical protein